MPRTAYLEGHVIQRHVETTTPIELGRYQSLLVPLSRVCLTVSIGEDIELLLKGDKIYREEKRKGRKPKNVTRELTRLRIFSKIDPDIGVIAKRGVVAGADIVKGQEPLGIAYVQMSNRGLRIGADLDPMQLKEMKKVPRVGSAIPLSLFLLESACSRLGEHASLDIGFGFSGLGIGPDMLDIRNNSTDDSVTFMVTPIHPDEA